MISREDFLLKESVDSLALKSKILPYRMAEKVKDAWLKERFETVLPVVMQRSGIDTWVIACNEYNEDPVLPTITPTAMFTARRLTILVFHLEQDGTVKRLALTRPNVGLDDFYQAVWINQKGSSWCPQPELAETQFECLNRIVTELKSEKIGLNISDHYAFADGLSKSLYDRIYRALSEENRRKITSAEKVAVGWLETRCQSEMDAYGGIVQIAHAIIDEAFSSRVVLPGVTTNADVKYFMLQRVIDLGLQPWFDFEVSIIRRGRGSIYSEEIILPGDILHCDFGLIYLGLYTDTQENAYVLKKGETDAPEYLKKILKDTNRLQDIVCRNFAEGRTGNEILKLSLEQAKAEGLKPCVYTHPIGNHGHAAGTTIGLWDQQDGVEYTGDYPIHDNTAYSLELNCTFDVEQWDTTFSLGLETDILFTKGKTYFLSGRQENYHLIR